MELARLITALSDPASYRGTVDAVEVRQTHISVVFLAGQFAYKVKKPVALGFLDFSTLERRRQSCEREVTLNRRLAPTVYRGVVAVTAAGGGLQMGGTGDAVEWAVKMERLPDSAALGERIRRGKAGRVEIEGVARRIAAFHQQAEAGSAIAACGRFDVVAGNARENLAQAMAHVGTTVSRGVFERLGHVTESTLAAMRPLIDRRAARGVPRDGHGDLRIDHVYLFPGRQEPSDMVVIDCIEFHERYRWADPVADIAFLVMDLAGHGQPELGQALADAYFSAACDLEGATLLPFYVSYRAAVRAKVRGIESLDPEIADLVRIAARDRARRHWLQALSVLEEPGRRPFLLLVGGLPGTGKSTLARRLAERSGFTVVRSDEVRKQLAGLANDSPAPAAYGEGLYSPEWSDRTYAECARQAASHLFEGRRVLVDASFGREAHRRVFLELACRWGVPTVLLRCRAEPSVVLARLAARRQDASDADWPIYLKAAARWEAPVSATRRSTWEIDSGGEAEVATVRAIDVLRSLGLEG